MSEKACTKCCTVKSIDKLALLLKEVLILTKLVKLNAYNVWTVVAGVTLILLKQLELL